MKIKLIRFPYRDYQVGEVVDLGDEKNKSMVALQRAVWLEPEKPRKKVKEKKEEVVQESVEVIGEEVPAEETVLKKKKKKKKMLVNKLGEKIQENTDGKKKSFWDNLK